MLQISPETKNKIIAWAMAVFFVASSFFVFNTVRAIPVEEIANVPQALQYVAERLGSIFFQNIGRKVINDFAFDAATYIGAGGEGQKALFVKEKWGNFWKNVGDKAAGDFVETFAKTVISDVASAQKKKDSTAQKNQCFVAGDACRAAANDAYQKALKDGVDSGKAGTIVIAASEACQKKQDACINNLKSEADQRADCDSSVQACKNDCSSGGRAVDVGPSLPQASVDACNKNCEIAYNYCWSNIAADRKAPTFNAKNSPLANVNICNPRLEVLIRIQFGLAAIGTGTAYQPDCSFSQMANNWKNEFDRQKSIFTNKNYLNDLAAYFRPGYNDLGVALELQSSLGNYKLQATTDSKAETTANGGWLDIRNFAGDLVGTPEEAKSRKKLTDEKLFQNLDKVTGDILVDAANIFINQLLITGWRSLTGSLVDDTRGSSPVSYWSAVSPGRKAIENKISQIKDQVYSDGKRLNVLADLSSCNDPENPGPTSCVIDTNFSNAITNKMTVAKAMDSGSLQKNWPFGFDKNGQEKLQYNQGYSYRSMLILRKYRILPVGWELAAQKIQQSYLLKGAKALGSASALTANVDDDFVTGKLKEGVSLEDMVSCFDYKDGKQGPDKYTSYGADWCSGLVDPNWVLKLPDYFCGRQGYGPELVQDFEIQDGGQKSCGVMNTETGAVSKVFVDGGYKNCSTDNDCCTRLENVAKGKNPAAACSATCSYQEAKLNFARSDKYCADEQSCLKEDSSGKCLAYGYCTAERRQWVFDQKGQDKSCEPYLNTCKSYSGNGQNVSFLENTLDFNNCNADNSGCRAYSAPDNYDVASAKATWAKDAPQIYFDAQAVKCAAGNEGCHQFIRTEIDGGANLIADAGFEAGDTARWQDFGTLYNSQSANFNQALIGSGTDSLAVSGQNKGVYFSPANRKLLPKGFEFESNQTYTLSASIYVESGTVEMGIGDSVHNNFTTVQASAAGWNRYTVTVDNDFNLQADSLKIVGIGTATFYLDDLKLEIGGPTAYNEYGSADLAYQKLLPDYLTRTCYVNPPVDYSLKPNAPAICSTFVRKCNKDEVGCNLFTDIINKDQIAAKVKPKDYCPGECLGYDKFIQQENNFYSAALTHFIPRTAKTCAASEEGCSLFVNLDKVPEGGEENEAYSEFRRCVKPDDSCADFITWEGSDVSGYQITSFKLQGNADNKTISQPRTVVDANALDDHDTDESGADLCSENIFKLPADHPLYNPDCRQFFGKDGNISYHLYSKTVACVDDCYFYRQVDQNIDETITTAADCEANIANGLADKKGQWLDDKDQCVVCRNGGTWDATHQACVFRAWPTESTTCKKEAVGCSKYTGDTGHNLRILFNDTFESNNNGAWTDGASDAQITNDALAVAGHSIQPASGNTLSKKLSAAIKAGKKYTLSFTARRRDQAAKIDGIVMTINQNGTNHDLQFTAGAQGLELTNKWKPYKFAIDNIDLSGTVTKVSFSGLSNSDQLRLDDIKLIEVDDVYYLIRNSWQTPQSCDEDHRGRPFPYYMSGCRAYDDMNGTRQNLRSFDELCQNSAAGCELMVDTFNSSFYGESTTNGIKTPADEMSYVVYDKSKTCGEAQKGCQLLGKANRIGALTNTYLLNNPDTYSESLCTKDALYCETWNQSGNNVYFKDPGEKTCEYLSPEGGSEGWYVKKQQYCFGNQTCSVNSDGTDTCGAGSKCVTDDKGAKYCSSKNLCAGQSDCANGETCKYTSDNVPCPVTYNKTIGFGVAVSKLQPYGMADKDKNGNIGNAGLCQTNAAGCTEYVDPESKFNFNAFLDSKSSVVLKLDTLYILKSTDNAPSTINCNGTNYIYQINHQTNELPLDSQQLSVTASPKDGKAFSQEFYIHNDTSSTDETVTCSVIGGEGSLREAVVAYRIKDSINKEAPTVAKFDEGKILFNERSQNGSTKKSLVYSTNLTAEGSVPQAISGNVNPPGNNANVLLAVDPDRTCSQWLACKTYIFNPLKSGERICIERKLCDRLNKANECSHFVGFEPSAGEGSNAAINQLYGSTIKQENISNMSGYSLAGYLGGNWASDYYHLAGMQEIGGAKIKIDSAGSFEGRSTTGFKTIAGADVPAISDPKVIEKELGLGAYRYVPDGQAVGKLSSAQASLDITNPGTAELVVSMKVFMRTGAKVSLRIGPAKSSDSCPLDSKACSTAGSILDAEGPSALVAEANTVGSWVPLIGRFSVADNYGVDANIKLWLVSDGLTYFDDLKIEPALVYRKNNGQEQFMQSVCRLFPQRDSLSCDYFDNSGLRRKGWSGYCLEYDPRNSEQCLMWYPIDKVAGEEFEEGAGLSIDKDLYYCVDAQDQCSAASPVVPEFGCRTFVKVNKDKYWHDRINEGSSYILNPNILNGGGALMVDFGVDNAPVKPGGQVKETLKNGIDWAAGSGFYGAFSARESIDSTEATKNPIATGVTGTGAAKKLMPIVPFFGVSNAGNGGKDDAYFCKATRNADGSDQAVEASSANAKASKLGIYDSCYVGIATQWANDDDSGCGIWNPFDRNCTNEAVHWKDCVGAGNTCSNGTKFECKKFLATGSSDEGCRVGNTNNSCEFDDEPDAACTVYKGQTDINTWYGHVSDCGGGLLGDGDAAGCFFDCYNHTKAYNIGASVNNSYYAVQRLFTQLDGCYTWNGSKYEASESDACKYWNGAQYAKAVTASSLQTMPACTDIDANGKVFRPNFSLDNNTKDYCFVRPTVANVKVSPAQVVNQGYVTLTFTSNVDPEQLPLRRVVVYYLGKDGQKTKAFNLSIFDHRDPANPHKFLLTYDVDDLNMQPGETREYRPCVEVYDNWFDAQSVMAGNGNKLMKSDINAASSCAAEPLIITKSSN